LPVRPPADVAVPEDVTVPNKRGAEQARRRASGAKNKTVGVLEDEDAG